MSLFTPPPGKRERPSRRGCAECGGRTETPGTVFCRACLERLGRESREKGMVPAPKEPRDGSKPIAWEDFLEAVARHEARRGVPADRMDPRVAEVYRRRKAQFDREKEARRRYERVERGRTDEW